MKNYKLNVISDITSIFESKCFTKEQDAKLKELGFIYNKFFKQYTKYYTYSNPYGGIEMVLFAKENEYMRFYKGRYILPCELEMEVKENYKALMKILKNDIKILKEIKVI